MFAQVQKRGMGMHRRVTLQCLLTINTCGAKLGYKKDLQVPH